jgi:hypothetical protein
MIDGHGGAAGGGPDRAFPLVLGDMTPAGLDPATPDDPPGSVRDPFDELDALGAGAFDAAALFASRGSNDAFEAPGDDEATLARIESLLVLARDARTRDADALALRLHLIAIQLASTWRALCWLAALTVTLGLAGTVAWAWPWLSWLLRI